MTGRLGEDDSHGCKAADSVPPFTFQFSKAPEQQVRPSALSFWSPLKDGFRILSVWELKALSTSARLYEGRHYEQCQEATLKLWPG